MNELRVLTEVWHWRIDGYVAVENAQEVSYLKNGDDELTRAQCSNKETPYPFPNNRIIHFLLFYIINSSQIWWCYLADF